MEISKHVKKELFNKYSLDIQNPQLAIHEINKLTDFRCPIYLVNDAEQEEQLNILYQDLVSKILIVNNNTAKSAFQSELYVDNILQNNFDTFDTPDASGKFHHREAFFNNLRKVKWHLDNKNINDLDLKWIKFIIENYHEMIKDVAKLTDFIRSLFNDENESKKFIEGINSARPCEIYEDKYEKYIEDIIKKIAGSNNIAERITHQVNSDGEVPVQKKQK